MIIDLILDRKDEDERGNIAVTPNKLDDFYIPVVELYPVDEIPEALRSGYCYHYNARAFYHRVMDYANMGGVEIARALDGGTEADVKRTLCEYIDRNEYNPEIKDYINAVEWLDGAA